jgi:hypothetical protein
VVKGLFLAALAGAGAMYLMDPVSGKMRRGQAVHLWFENKNEVYEGAGKAADSATKVTAGLADRVSTATYGPQQSGKGDANSATGGVDQHVVA